MILTIIYLIVAWLIATLIKKFLFKDNHAPKLKQVIVIIAFLISMLCFWSLILNELNVDAPSFKANFNKALMDSVLIAITFYLILDPFNKFNKKS